MFLIIGPLQILLILQTPEYSEFIFHLLESMCLIKVSNMPGTSCFFNPISLLSLIKYINMIFSEVSR